MIFSWVLRRERMSVEMAWEATAKDLSRGRDSVRRVGVGRGGVIERRSVLEIL